MDETSNGLKVLRVLKRVKHSIKHNVMQQFKEMQLTAPQGMVIGILGHYGRMKVSDLSEKLGLSNSTVSGIVDRLEKQGLVERIRSGEDRRVVYVSMTANFSKTAQEHFGEVERMLENIMSKATPEELDIILSGLETLEKLMDNQKEQL